MILIYGKYLICGSPEFGYHSRVPVINEPGPHLMGVVNRTDINEGKNIDIATAVGLKRKMIEMFSKPVRKTIYNTLY